jgi:hypothetical protein
MRTSPSIIVGALIIVFVVLALRFWAKGGVFPPHEFAYGAALKNMEAIPAVMDQFLSSETLDPNQFRIQTFVGNSSEKNLKPLIKYISSQRDHDFAALLGTLDKIDQLSDQKEKSIQLVKALLPYKELLHNEPQQDSIIVFVYYGLKQPSALPQASRAKIGNLVKQLDNAKQSAEFDSGKCPDNYLVGNINVYPLALENTSWHNTVDFGSDKRAPILEIRFMGLKGMFRYLVDEMTAKTGLSFLHLDGESL